MSARLVLAGARPLFRKEVLRFWKVSFQTVAAPVLTAVMYLLIFGHVLANRVQVYDNVGYTQFLIPGLVMMSVLQNAFANSSSSLIQSNSVAMWFGRNLARPDEMKTPIHTERSSQILARLAWISQT